MKKKILGAALGNCIHVGGLHNFLKLAEAEGYETISLGPSVSPNRIIDEMIKYAPTITAISYRLTPEVAVKLFEELKQRLTEKKNMKFRLVLGGTPPVVEVARQSGLFEKLFDGSESTIEIKSFLRGAIYKEEEIIHADNLISRIRQKYPYPLLRHHFGRPTIAETIKGVTKIAQAQIVDVISLAPDQNAQEYFFHPEEMDHSRNGAGGVPIRTQKEFESLYQASRCGNYPLMRCYSGTRDLIRWAEMSIDTIHNAWGAIPLCWYSVIDGRSTRSLFDAITENLQTIRWYAGRDIPVEVNESHQWSLRDAHDSLAVAMAFLAAYNAKKVGVHNYIAQYMFNTPPGTSPAMDIAKMLAKIELIENLHDEYFTSYREARAGIAHFSSNAFAAKGQGAASALISLSIKPHILHVVGFSEGDHATHPDELIESCEIAHGVLHDCLHGLPDMSIDPKVIQRKKDLIEEASILLDAIKKFGIDISDDPWNDPKVLSDTITLGLLDAPHFRGNPFLCGIITTRLIDGAWYAVNEITGKILSEEKRTKNFFKNHTTTIAT